MMMVMICLRFEWHSSSFQSGAWRCHDGRWRSRISCEWRRICHNLTKMTIGSWNRKRFARNKRKENPNQRNNWWIFHSFCDIFSAPPHTVLRNFRFMQRTHTQRQPSSLQLFYLNGIIAVEYHQWETQREITSSRRLWQYQQQQLCQQLAMTDGVTATVTR